MVTDTTSLWILIRNRSREVHSRMKVLHIDPLLLSCIATSTAWTLFNHVGYYITIQSAVIVLRTTFLVTSASPHLPPEFICGFCIILRMRCYFSKQRWPIEISYGEALCLLWGSKLYSKYYLLEIRALEGQSNKLCIFWLICGTNVYVMLTCACVKQQ
jgi:hypothetical protein